MIAAATLNVNLAVAIPVAVGLVALITVIVKATLVFSKLDASIDALRRAIDTLSLSHTDLDTRVKSLEDKELVRTAKEAAQSTTGGTP